MILLDIINEIKNEPSSNEKLVILEKYKDNEILKLVLQYTYNPLYNYYIKPTINIIDDDSIYEATVNFGFAVFPMLDKLINRDVTGHAALAMINDTAMQLEKEDRVVLQLIFNRDLDMGLATKSINKVFPDLIPTVPYMRCSLTDKLDRITYPAMVQQKCDGMFVNVVIKDGTIEFITRNGTVFDLNCIKEDLLEGVNKHGYHNGLVLHGELLVLKNNDEVQIRKIGNGLINSLIKKEQTLASLQEKIDSKKGNTQDKLASELARKIAEYDNTDKMIQLVLWDAVPYDDWIKGECDIPYVTQNKHMESRWAIINDFVDDSLDNHIKLVECLVVENYKEAQEFYREQIANYYEGAVLKNWGMMWKNHTSPEQIKLKAEKECELRVIGYEPGTGKYEGGIGSLICESSDGKLCVSVGSGLRDSDRGFEREDEGDSSKGLVLLSDFDVNMYTGNIISVKFNELIKSDSKDSKHSLFLPRFIEVRTDKDEADDLDKIKKL